MSSDEMGTAPIEWIGGVKRLDEIAVIEGPSIQPTAVVFVNADGFVIGARVVAPADVPSAAREIVATALEEVAEPGALGSPAVRIRVSSEALAAELQMAFPTTDIRRAPTPELDEVLESMQDHLASRFDATPSLLPPGGDPKYMGALFEAAAQLHRVAPWTIIPDDGCLIRVDAPEEGLVGGVLTVVGQAGESFGFLLFDDIEGYDAYLSMADRAQADPDAALDPPPHLALSFDHRDELDQAVLEEIESHGWEVNAPDGFPCPWIVDDEGEARSLGEHETVLLEAVARALASLPALEPDLAKAWDEGNADGISRSVPVTTADGEIDVKLSVTPDYFSLDTPELVAEMTRYAEETEFFTSAGEDRAFALEEALAQRFAGSAEGKNAPATGSARLVLTLARIHLGQPLQAFDDGILETVLLELFPAHVDIDPGKAADIVKEVRGFFEFLLRECDLPAAHRCLPLLSGETRADVVKILAARLADPTNFEPFKAMMMDARADGIDLEDPDSIDRWMLENSSRFLPPLPGDDRDAPPRKATRPKKTAKQRKNKRKQARKSRKRNR